MLAFVGSVMALAIIIAPTFLGVATKKLAHFHFLRMQMLEISCDLFHGLLLNGEHGFGELFLIGLWEGVKNQIFS